MKNETRKNFYEGIERDTCPLFKGIKLDDAKVFISPNFMSKTSAFPFPGKGVINYRTVIHHPKWLGYI